MNTPTANLRQRVLDQVQSAPPSYVWMPSDFTYLGSRDAVDKVLQRLVKAGQLRRIDRGLYDRPRTNKLTQRLAPPDYRAVLDAIGRRDNVRLLIDGLTAANDLGLTNAVPAHVTIHTDLRRRSLRVGGLTVKFSPTAPSRLYWAGRPAMRVVQALYWLKDTIGDSRAAIITRLRSALRDPRHGPAIRQDLLDGFAKLPSWMQPLVRDALGDDRGASVGH